MNPKDIHQAAAVRQLIINADDFGMCHTYNTTIKRLLAQGFISSTSLMVPCPWARDAAHFSKQHPELDVGIHLTFTSEWEHYKWGPLSGKGGPSSLTTREGWFHAGCADFEKHATAEDVQREIRAQIDQAIAWGVEPTHVDVHMYSLLGFATGRDFMPAVLEACKHYGLPLRLPRSYASLPGFSQATMDRMQSRIAMADAAGVAIVDDSRGLDFFHVEGSTYEQAKQEMIGMLRGLKPGVSEILLHPAQASDEVRTIMPRDFPRREMEARLFADEEIMGFMRAEQIQVIGWRDLRGRQRDRSRGRAYS